MNTQSNAVSQSEVSANPSPIKELSQLAPVVPSETGIAVTDKQVQLYCDQVVAGKPTGKIFPNKLSELAFTPEQRDAIRAARAEHKLNCINAKKTLLAIVRGKHIDTIGHRTNRQGTMGSIRYAHKSAITNKDGAYRDAFLFGATPKNG